MVEDNNTYLIGDSKTMIDVILEFIMQVDY